MKEKTVCKKCNKPLPEVYKYDEYEHCLGEKAELAKKIINGEGVSAGVVLSIGLLILTKGKFGRKK